MQLAVPVGLNALACLALLRVRLHKQVLALALCSLAFALVCWLEGCVVGQRAALLGKLTGCCMLTYWLEQGRRAQFARAVMNRVVPATPSQLRPF